MKSVFSMGALAILLALVLPPTDAYGKRAKRNGFNFGAGVRVLSNLDNTKAAEENTSTIVDSGQEIVSPYIGYSFGGTFNLGLSFESSNLMRQEKFVDYSGLEIEKSMDRSTQSGSIFTRFLFGQIFFMEFGAGIYKEKEEQKTKTFNIALNGQFTGETDLQTFEGIGKGYHMSAGFEIPTGAGFYFTGSYTARLYNIREGDGMFDRGNRKSSQQQRNLLFGLAHYYN